MAGHEPGRKTGLVSGWDLTEKSGESYFQNPAASPSALLESAAPVI
jgi:hypothetical protein